MEESWRKVIELRIIIHRQFYQKGIIHKRPETRKQVTVRWKAESMKENREFDEFLFDTLNLLNMLLKGLDFKSWIVRLQPCNGERWGLPNFAFFLFAICSKEIWNRRPPNKSVPQKNKLSFEADIIKLIFHTKEHYFEVRHCTLFCLPHRKRFFCWGCTYVCLIQLANANISTWITVVAINFLSGSSNKKGSCSWDLPESVKLTNEPNFESRRSLLLGCFSWSLRGAALAKLIIYLYLSIKSLIASNQQMAHMWICVGSFAYPPTSSLLTDQVSSATNWDQISENWLINILYRDPAGFSERNKIQFDYFAKPRICIHGRSSLISAPQFLMFCSIREKHGTAEQSGSVRHGRYH